MTDIAALIARVGALTGPDREVDYEITRKVLKRPIGTARWTASVDAAISLVERVLPGYDWGRQDGFMFVSDGDDFAEAKHDLPAIALTLAALKALQAQEADRG